MKITKIEITSSHNIPENGSKKNIETFLKENNIDINNPEIKKKIKLLEIEKAKTREETKDKLMWLLASIGKAYIYEEKTTKFYETEEQKPEIKKEPKNNPNKKIEKENEITDFLGNNQKNSIENKISEKKTSSYDYSDSNYDYYDSKYDYYDSKYEYDNSKYDYYDSKYDYYDSKYDYYDSKYDYYDSKYDYDNSNKKMPAPNIMNNSYYIPPTSSNYYVPKKTNPSGMPENGTYVNGWSGNIGNASISISGSGNFYYDEKNKSVTIKSGGSTICSGLVCNMSD